MSKAILVLDEMPVHCDQCPLWEDHDDWDEMVGRCVIKNGVRSRTYGRPLWCPLKEMPEPMHPQGGVYPVYNEGYMAGWNKCLKEIGGAE